MQTFLAEAIGTMMLIVLGDGVVANVVLNGSKGDKSGWIVIATGWGVAVAMAVYAVGRISGAHLNPAVTIGWPPSAACRGPTCLVTSPRRCSARLSARRRLARLPATLARHRDPGAKLAVFAPARPSRTRRRTSSPKSSAPLRPLRHPRHPRQRAEPRRPGDIDLRCFSRDSPPLLVGILVFGVGLSLGGPTGYAINPARDLGPRLAHFVLPIPGKGDSDWRYAWIPIVGPLLGGSSGQGFTQ